LSTQNWLTLMDYSAKYRVSLSTLRRRIKAGEIEYKFADGKYLLKDGPLQVTSLEAETIAPPLSVSSQPRAEVHSDQPADHGQYWAATQSLLNEIKKAYSLILQEKEEQLLQLKEEVADLKTLVRVLEDENSRIKESSVSSVTHDFDLGLEA
jgi:hypothetical protein